MCGGLVPNFDEFHQSIQRMVHRSWNAEFGAAPRDVPDERINFRALAAHQVLSSRRIRFGHWRGDLESTCERHWRILKSRRMNARRFGDSQNLVYSSFDHLARVGARRNLPVWDACQSGDGVQRALPGELGPKFAGDRSE